MSTPALLEKEAVTHSPEEISRWLHDQSGRLGIDIVPYPDEAEMRGYYLYMPAYLPDGKDAYDYSVKLQKFEDAWNDQEPPPNPPLNLTSARSPEQRAVRDRLWRARDHKTEAANAVAEANNETEQQIALSELREARREEVQAEKEYNAFYGLNGAA